ncbi:MAG: sigma-54 interaction domain-containing protein [Emergencia timonensis]|uniref:sigma-54 interaction domain-containing protein n=1 Tax=Emergencia timonensis TaxID=1776384 RepID=UPI000835C440|nr:sigma 54-interacting transcriptional regulator [Emergencia timonensis]
MDQVLAIQKVKEKIRKTLDSGEYQDGKKMADFLQEIDHDLEVFLAQGIDFKIVVDALDDSIFITDKEGTCLYVNPAHQRNTEILPEEVLGRKVSDITAEGKLFTGGATMDVIESKKKIFRLSTVNKTNPPSVGYAVGVPIFDQYGALHQVVVSSRPILTLQALQEDFGKFLQEANALNKSKENVRILENATTPDFKSNKLVGSSYSLQKVWNTIKMAAPTDATVLITGESGVGKEVVADEIYRLSARSHKTFIKVNCASIPANLLESELFGYERGAFSGANTSGKQGLFEMADGGTLLLDEIGDMSMDLQVKLLRAIQTKEITRVGGTKPIHLDIRFIAATNSDLKKKIADGTFRQDLYYRLNVIPICIPPLRERLNDLDELCAHFVDEYTKKHNRDFVLTQDQLAIMKQYTWPGNIRELENVIEYLTICASGTKEVADEMLKGLLDISQGDEGAVASGTLSQSLENYEKALIESVLRDSTSLRDAGAKLGVNASTISRKIKQYGIDYPAAVK